MPKKEKQTTKVEQVILPCRNLESDPDLLSAFSELADEDTEIITDEDPYETQPYQQPAPGEGP